MRIAIFHNFMDNIGGAEIVTLTLARELDADIYTTNINLQHIEEMGFKDVQTRIFSIGKVPVRAPLRHQLASRKFRKLNLKGKYDFFIISGDWAMSGGVNNFPNLWYVHSPLHELWAFKDYVRQNLLTFWKRPIYDVWVYINRKLTLRYSKHVEKIACNSQNTKERIEKYYRRESVVITPPTYTHDFTWNKPEGYWLSVNRVVIHKRIELQMEAFSKLRSVDKMIMVASYEIGAEQFENYREKLLKIKPENIEMRSWIPHKELTELYSKCTGFITTATHEDFGLTAIEAMAAGKPVIAPNEGGYRETIINGKTGILIDNIDPEKIINAMREIEDIIKKNPAHYKDACIGRASKFDTERFINQIRASIGIK